MSRGIVVDHKETGVRFALSLHNYDPAVHTMVRDLLPGETVLGYKPRASVSEDDADALDGIAGPTGDAGDLESESRDGENDPSLGSDADTLVQDPSGD